MSNENEKLKAWCDKNRWMFDIFLDAVCVIDTENRVFDFNTAFEELCGESYRKIMKIGNFCDLVSTEGCPDECPSRTIIKENRSIRLDEVSGTSKAFPELHMIIGGVPILSETSEVLGALVTIRNVSAESELQKKYDERKKDAARDGLTKLFNKTYAETLIIRMLKTSIRDHKPLTIAMVDIDHFKKVNDNYGHQAGDLVLATVSSILQDEARESDLVGRFGGEEFIVCLHNTEAPGANIFAERFRTRISQTKVEFEGKVIPITTSLGTATFKEPWQPGMDQAEGILKEVISRADTGLYYAKATGRNRTCQFENLPADAANPHEISKLKAAKKRAA